MAGKLQIQESFQKLYDLEVFKREILNSVFTSEKAKLFREENYIDESNQLTASEKKVILKVVHYGNLELDDYNTLKLYEITLQPKVRIEQSKVGIQQYVRKMLIAGEGVLVNFINQNDLKTWRLTLVASDTVLTDKGISVKKLNPKRFTFIVGKSEQNKTISDRFADLEKASRIVLYPLENDKNAISLVNIFSVETLSKAFFDEYTLHYKLFTEYIQNSNLRKSIFNITIPQNAKKEELDIAYKPIRDFVKKMLGRIVFLYFVQKKGWLGASNTNYEDGSDNFIFELFQKSGANEKFYNQWLSKLFFETLNKPRKDDNFTTPDASIVKIPYLNGGLFDSEEYDNLILTFNPKLFHSEDFEDVILTDKLLKKNDTNHRGFLDFLNSFNFTVHEDSPEDHTVAVDPEMLGHIFENLLEDNKDKGAFYTPKEIVHYMCQESLIEYLTTHLSKEYTVYRAIGNQQVEMFGNEIAQGQLQMMESLGDKALDREAIASIVKNKDISSLTAQQLTRMSELLNTVKICDPAIGSGAFPMGLLQEIFAIKELIAFETSNKWEPAKVKENIIQNSIYGVDVEKGAVDIARLRFWLSLIVNEEKPKALPNLDYKIVVGDSLLSKFEDEIIEINWDKIGSVGKADVYVKNVQRLLKEVAKKQKDYFNEEGKSKKGIAAEIRDLKIDLLINQISFNKESYANKNTVKIDNGLGLSAKDLKTNDVVLGEIDRFNNSINNLLKIKSDKLSPFKHFDWKLDFPEILNPLLFEGNKDSIGFDIVIANPPYIGQSGNRDLFRDVLKTKLGEDYHQRRMDYFYFFFHKSIRLSKKETVISFITTNYFFNATYADKLRKDIYLNCDIIKLINFNEAKIFESATGQHNAITIMKVGKKSQRYVKTSTTTHKGIINGKTINTILYGDDPKTSYFKFLSSEIFENEKFHILIEGSSEIESNNPKNNVLKQINTDSIKLINIADVVQGIVSGANDLSQKYKEEFNIDKPIGCGILIIQKNELELLNLNDYELSFIKPWYKNSDVSKWNCNKETSQYLIYLTSKDDIDISKIPNLIKHFEPFKELLLNRNVRTGRYTIKDYDLFLKGEKVIPYVMIKSSFKKGLYYLVSYSRDKSVFENEKIVCPQRSSHNTFGYTNQSWYAASDVYYIVKNESTEISLKYLLAILNSKLTFFWLYNKGQRKGEILQLFKDPLSDIPIKIADEKTQNKLIVISDYILFAKDNLLDENINKLLTTYLEQIVDGIVYELYFPELLKQYNRTIIEHLGDLPPFTDKMKYPQKIEIINTVFNRLNEKNHPVRVNLFYMSSIPEIAIIEGKK